MTGRIDEAAADELTILMKPASSACNMRCSYCFYNDVSRNRHTRDYGMMSRDTAEAIILRAMEEAKRRAAPDDGCVISICFQGGEPTLWGLDNYRFFVDLASGQDTRGYFFKYTLQTNGILLDADWIEFLCENDFLVGLSVDGYKHINDINRLDIMGDSTYSKVLKAASLLGRRGVHFNILSVVTDKTARYADKLLKFFLSQNLRDLQFIPCVDGFGSESSHLSAAQCGVFLKASFDIWYQHQKAGEHLYIRFFNNILNMFQGRQPEQCSMGGHCAIQLTVEADGSVYPCDFYVLDEWRLGNVHNDRFFDMLSSETAKRFISESAAVNEECAKCRWLALCRGGCKRDKEPIINGRLSSNRFCSAYKDFFCYSYDRFVKLCSYISR